VAGLDEAKIAGMNGTQRRAVRDGLAAAFPSRGRLADLLDGLDKILTHYAAESLSLPDAVFNVVDGAKTEGWLAQLLAEAAAVNPGNRQLAEVVDHYRRTTAGTDAGNRVGGTPFTAPGAGENGYRSAATPSMSVAPPSDRQVIMVLGDEFPDLADARRLVSEAGLSPGRQPAWNVANAQLYWWEVHRLFTGGVVLGGWANVLREAYRARPANAILAAAAAAAGVGNRLPVGAGPPSAITPTGSQAFPAGGLQVGNVSADGGIAVGVNYGQIAGQHAGDQQTHATARNDSTAGDDRGVDFFVSYTQADVRWAEWIAWTLEEAGYRVLVQAWDMPGGSNWVAVMQNGVQHAARTVAVLSAAYSQSVYGAAEWQAAWAKDPDGAGRKLLVFRIEDCDRPGLLDQVVSRDLYNITQDKARTRLLETAKLAIGGGRAKPTTPPVFPGAHQTPPFPSTA
jgi:hypothetical protein